MKEENNKSRPSCDKSQKYSHNKCKRIRQALPLFLSKYFSVDSQWFQNHIAICPRCQRRLAGYGKVRLAFSCIMSQSHNTDLLRRANSQAVGVLKHSLREAPRAEKLKKVMPKPGLKHTLAGKLQPFGHIAACLAILCLMKIGVFSTMEKTQSNGRKVIRQYYTSRLGPDIADTIFPENSAKT